MSESSATKSSSKRLKPEPAYVIAMKDAMIAEWRKNAPNGAQPDDRYWNDMARAAALSLDLDEVLFAVNHVAAMRTTDEEAFDDPAALVVAHNEQITICRFALDPPRKWISSHAAING